MLMMLALDVSLEVSYANYAKMFQLVSSSNQLIVMCLQFYNCSSNSINFYSYLHILYSTANTISVSQLNVPVEMLGWLMDQFPMKVVWKCACMDFGAQ